MVVYLFNKAMLANFNLKIIIKIDFFKILINTIVSQVLTTSKLKFEVFQKEKMVCRYKLEFRPTYYFFIVFQNVLLINSTPFKVF